MKKTTRYRLLGFVAVIIVLGMVSFRISKSRTFQFFGSLVSEVNTNNKVVALTFDDGPATNTDTILDILQRYNVKATFFLTGEEMTGQPELCRRIISEGHSVGNHSFSHKMMMLKSRSFIKQEVERTDSIIRACGFKGNIYFRPPYCKKFIYLPYYLKQTNRTTVTWNIEPDSKHMDAPLIIKDVAQNMKPGSIILLHAMYKSRQGTLEALPGIIEWLQRNGYDLITVNELLEKNARSCKVITAHHPAT